MKTIQEWLEHLTLNEFEAILLSDCYGQVLRVSTNSNVPNKRVRLGFLIYGVIKETLFLVKKNINKIFDGKVTAKNSQG